MQTRRLRLGDVVDDYCPRERRLSNHVVVAMVDDAIKQTRCTTCDFEHPYKDGKLPARRKKKDATAELYQQVLEGMIEKPPSTAVSSSEEPAERPAVLAMAAGASSPVAVPAVAPRPAVTNLRTRSTKSKAAGAAASTADTSSAAAPVPGTSSVPSVPAATGTAPGRVAAKSTGAGSSTSTRAAAAGTAAGSAHPSTTRATTLHAPTPDASTPASAPRVVTPPSPARIAPSSGEPPRLAPPPAPVAPPAASAHAPARAGAGHAAAPESASPQHDHGDDEKQPGGENEPLHRRTLIRAQLPRPVGEVPTRQAPTFTIREAARAPKFRRPFARNARPQGGQNGVGVGPRNAPQPRGGKKGGAPQGAHRFGSGQGQGGHHAKGRPGNQGNKRFK